jgi:hypothetical protein
MKRIKLQTSYDIQSIFYLKTHQNNIFLKKLFLTSAYQNNLKI